jgi:MFS transporter, DHA2 family, multidrug resistance protein
MSAGATRAGAPAAASGAGADPWLIAVLVAVAVFMEVLDTTIANVALRYIAGGLGVSEDEASWVVTTYLVANAIIVMATELCEQVVRPQGSFPHLPRIVHPELSALRNGRGS